MTIKKCNLCNAKVKLMHPSDVYGPGYKHKSDAKEVPGIPVSYIYQCTKCDGRVGCHGDTKKPLGTLAGKELRNARQRTHQLLDPLWQDNSDGDYKSGTQGKKRKELYQMISNKMRLKLKDTHIGSFDIDQCRKAYKIILEYKLKI